MKRYGKSNTEYTAYPDAVYSDYEKESPPACPLLGLTIAVGVTLLLLAFVGINVWTAHAETERLTAEQLKTQRLIDEIVYLDEGLTMSARMAVATAQPLWQERYFRFEKKLNASTKELVELLPGFESPERVDSANIRLVELEKKAFDLVNSGRAREAMNLLLGEEYESNKQIYAENIGKTARTAQARIEENLDDFHDAAGGAAMMVVLGLSILIFVWPCVLIQARKRAAERQQAHSRIRQINRQLEDSIQRTNLMARKAAEASNAKSDFLANMSHEIRTPMNAIVGFAEVLADGKLTTEQKGHVGIIRDSARSLLETVNDILDISKIEAGKLDIQLQSCRLDRLLNSIESMMRPQAEENGLKFQVLTSDSLPPRIETDALRLRQCLINLVGNAIKFTTKGHVYINANLQEDNGKAYVRFDVEDTGVGIASEEQQAVFESFVQAERSARSFGGTGLGLTITKELTKLLGGKLTVTSELGRGSVFSLVIPAGDEATLENALALVQPKKVDATEQINADEIRFEGKVLVAEDTLSSQMLIKLLLEKIGFDVTIAKDGAEALRRAHNNRYDLIFMDIHMPNMDGYEATRKLRKTGVLTPVIALTANAMKGDDSKCFAAGCNDYLTKPIDRKWLLCVLQKYLDPVGIALTPNDKPPAS